MVNCETQRQTYRLRTVKFYPMRLLSVIKISSESFDHSLSIMPHRRILIFFSANNNRKIKSSLYSRYYAKACNPRRGPSPRLSVWAPQLRRNVAVVASRWRHCVRFDLPKIQTPDILIDNNVLTAELTGPHFSL